MKVFADLQSRGCQDILIAVTDGLKGMREALEALYPATTFQTCLVHLLRHSLDFANWKERKPLAAALRPIYTAASADVAAAALDAFADEPWDRRSRPSSRPGDGPGRTSSRSSRSPRPSVACSIRPMRWRASTRGCARSSKLAAIFRPTRRPRR